MASPGPGKGWRQTRRSGQAEFGADRADLVLEQRSQRLDQRELEVLGQTADVVVGLDRRRAGPAAGLDHVRVEGPLHEETDVVELVRLLLEHADELGADQLALAFGIADPGELGQEALLGVHGDERHLEVIAEGQDDLLALVLAHQTVVDEHTGQLVADRLVDEQRGDAGVNPAGEAADRPPLPDLSPDARDLVLDHRRRAPGPLTAADVEQEVGQHLLPVGRVDDLGMELDPVDLALGRFEGRHRRRRRGGERAETGRRREHRVAVRHPARLFGAACRRAGARSRSPSAASVRTRRPRRPRPGRRARGRAAACRNRCRAREPRARATRAPGAGRRRRRPRRGRRTGSPPAAGGERPPRPRHGGAAARRTRRTRAHAARSAANTGRRSQGR